MKLITLAALIAVTPLAKAEIFKLDVAVKGSLQVKYVETEEACALTVDPSWSHEEDTSMARSIQSNRSYFQTKDEIDALNKEGYRFYKYDNGDKCDYTANGFNSTFPVFKNPNPMNGFVDDVFYYGVSNKKLAEYAKKQGAYKKVKRIYIKGGDTFVKKATAAAKAELEAALKSL